MTKYSSIKGHKVANWIKNREPTIFCLQETHIKEMDILIHRLKSKDGKRDKKDGKIYHAKGNDKKQG